MDFAFDLISDLHVETWDPVDWTGQPTAPYCVVAGDIGRDRNQVLKTLTHLGECYAGVFYIDGNDEHRHYMDDLGGSYQDIAKQIQKINSTNRVVYMQDSVVIINGVALLATNGWWSYDFDPDIDRNETQRWYEDYLDLTNESASSVIDMAYYDASYFMNSVSKLQTHQDVQAIVLISHTLPSTWLVNHDMDLVGTHRYNCIGNQHLELALDADTENKIKAWCFGHYHKSVDRNHMGIRYVSNPKGRGNTPWSQPVYYPKRIDIKY
jgi:predicted phosphodiesterase